MKKERFSYLQIWLTVLYVAALMISNVITSRSVLLPGNITMTGGVFIFPITYILSDVFSEVYGYKWSRITCYMAFAMNLFMVIIFALIIHAPAPDYFTDQEAFEIVLGGIPRILVASFTAFVLGDFVNDRIFRKMKEKYPDTTKGFGFRAILSSLFGELTDSLIFFPLAFFGSMPVDVLIILIFTEVLIKTGYEVIILPITTVVAHKLTGLEKDENLIDE